MSARPLDRLTKVLETEFSRDARGRRVAGLLAEYAAANDDWKDFIVFDRSNYTRNLLHRCEYFEVLLLCWESEQASPIHDHAGQDCWMAVLEGELEEQHYSAPDGVPGPLVEGRRSQVQRGNVAFIQDGIALHRIRPLHGARGMSLHLYSRPIDTCRVYAPGTGLPTVVELGYHSVRGELCRTSPAEIRADWASRLR
jgi:cysteine dioxygenase